MDAFEELLKEIASVMPTPCMTPIGTPRPVVYNHHHQHSPPNRGSAPNRLSHMPNRMTFIPDPFPEVQVRLSSITERDRHKLNTNNRSFNSFADMS